MLLCFVRTMYIFTKYCSLLTPLTVHVKLNSSEPSCVACIQYARYTLCGIFIFRSVRCLWATCDISVCISIDWIIACVCEYLFSSCPRCASIVLPYFQPSLRSLLRSGLDSNVIRSAENSWYAVSALWRTVRLNISRSLCVDGALALWNYIIIFDGPNWAHA